MRIRKRNNVIYWLGFCIFFVPLIWVTIPFIFNNVGADFTDTTIITKYTNYIVSIYDYQELVNPNDIPSFNFGFVISYLSSLPLFSWIQHFVYFICEDLDMYGLGEIIICFISWVLIYNEIWLFIRVFLWFFDIPNELLERSVNIV